MQKRNLHLHLIVLTKILYAVIVLADFLKVSSWLLWISADKSANIYLTIIEK